MILFCCLIVDFVGFYIGVIFGLELAKDIIKEIHKNEQT